MWYVTDLKINIYIYYIHIAEYIYILIKKRVAKKKQNKQRFANAGQLVKLDTNKQYRNNNHNNSQIPVINL